MPARLLPFCGNVAMGLMWGWRAGASALACGAGRGPGHPSNGDAGRLVPGRTGAAWLWSRHANGRVAAPGMAAGPAPTPFINHQP